MAQRLLLVTVAFFAAFLVVSGGSVSSGDPVYGNEALDVQKSIYFQGLGKYAVACYNLLSQQQLTFQKVISCDSLPGLSHKLTIAASDGGVTKTYEAVVFDKPVFQIKKLISFKLA